MTHINIFEAELLRIIFKNLKCVLQSDFKEYILALNLRSILDRNVLFICFVRENKKYIEFLQIVGRFFLVMKQN